jgi:ubiquinone/menaquinone biosynthesis C-methylase UbiE
MFKALADETRLRLVHLSLHYELNVNEIVSVMGMGQSRISRHLKILTDSRLLTYRRDGLWTFYSAAAEGDGHAFIESVKYLFDEDPVSAKDIEEAKRVLDERAKETVRFFDSIAEDWEKLKREIIGDVDLNGLILQNIPNAHTALDLGCGTGDLLLSLKERAVHVIGVEKSPRMLETARKRFAGLEKDIDLRIGELEHLPLREGEADLAVVNMVLHHLPEPVKAFSEVHRVLKKGNAFVIVDLLSHELESMRERYGDRWLGFTETDIKEWLKAGGFKVTKIEYFDLKKNLKGFFINAVKK